MVEARIGRAVGTGILDLVKMSYCFNNLTEYSYDKNLLHKDPTLEAAPVFLPAMWPDAASGRQETVREGGALRGNMEISSPLDYIQYNTVPGGGPTLLSALQEARLSNWRENQRSHIFQTEMAMALEVHSSTWSNVGLFTGGPGPPINKAPGGGPPLRPYRY